MTSSLLAWASRHGITLQALAELRIIFGLEPISVPPALKMESEAAVQARVRLEAGRKGVKLWRNNVGVLEDTRGIPVRFGLANDSKQLNGVIKSGDLIGWRPVLIGPQHLGTLIAQFVSRECKRPNWRYSGDAREQAQLKWAEAVVGDGGDAAFCTGEGSL